MSYSRSLPTQRSTRARWPQWTEVMAYWRTLDVTSIEVRPWSTDRSHCLWDRKESYDEPRQHAYRVSSPQHTAYYIAADWPKLTDDERAAFVLEAYCREQGFHEFLSRVVFASGFPRRWSRNAVYILPAAGDHTLGPMTEKEQAERWQEILRGAAEQWRDVAGEWVVVRTPRLMDPRSQEFAEYNEWMTRRREEYEREEYERLREKFESPNR